MTQLVVGVADCRISDDPEGVLLTYALGSCVGLAIHDPVARVGGLLHFMLPESAIDPDKARQNPWMFADTGIPLLLQNACQKGAQKRRLVVRAAGGAQFMDEQGIFNIGKRNCLAMRKLLWRAGVVLRDEAVGGTVSRNLRLEIRSGRAWLRTGTQPEQELRGLGGVS
jgi:chemotaxis protein CheD